MCDYELYKPLFDISGLSAGASSRSIYIQQRLCEILLSRINGENKQNYDTLNELETSRSDSLYLIDSRTISPISYEFCEKYPDWSFNTLTLSDECALDSWNTFSGFMYDVKELYIIGLAMQIQYCDIEQLTEDDIADALDFYQENFFEEEEEEVEETGEKEDFLNDIISLFKDILKAMNEGTTYNSFLLQIAKDFRCRIFHELISIENVFRNFNTIMQFCFGVCNNTERTLLILSNKNIPSYLKLRDSFEPTFRDFMQHAMECISNPVCNEGYLGQYPFTCCDDTNYTIVIPIGYYSGAELTEHHFRPFFYEAACAISECLSRSNLLVTS